MQRAVEDVGYAVPTSELTLDVRGMTCGSCVAHVEDALNELDGVEEAVVNLGLGTARVTYIPGVVSTSRMKRAVRDVGYEASERMAWGRCVGVRCAAWGPPMEVDVRNYQEGTLLIDMIDAKGKTLQWRGSTSKRLPSKPSRSERDALVKEVVDAIIAKYPN